MASKWEARKIEIERMVAEGMTDDQIGVLYQVTGSAVYLARKRLGIVPQVKRPRKSMQEIFDAMAPTPLEPVDTYVDEAGRTVKRYPARYAEGAFTQPVTARPRR